MGEEFVSWMALGVAIVGVVLAGGSLLWQYLSWRDSGPVIAVELGNGISTLGDELRPGYAVLIVTARNRGRAPVQVTGWGLRLPDGRDAVQPRNLAFNPVTPATIEGGHHLQWLLPFPLLDHLVTAPGFTARGWVRLATGDIRVSRSLGVDHQLVASQTEEWGPLFR